MPSKEKRPRRRPSAAVRRAAKAWLKFSHLCGGWELDFSRNESTRWLEDTDDELIYFSVVSIGEVCKGLTIHPQPHRRAWLRHRAECT